MTMPSSGSSRSNTTYRPTTDEARLPTEPTASPRGTLSRCRRRSCRPPRCRGDRACSVMSTRTNEIANSRVATAAASSGLNWRSSWKMNTGAVSVLPVMLPAQDHDAAELTGPARTTAAHRPRWPGLIAGKTTRRKVVQPVGAEGRRGLLLGRVELQQHRLHRADHERQGDEQQRQHDAERREDDVDAEVARGTPPIGEFGP